MRGDVRQRSGDSGPFRGDDMARTPSLASMSVDALLKLRDDIRKVLSGRVHQLRDQLSRLGEEVRDGRAEVIG